MLGGFTTGTAGFIARDECVNSNEALDSVDGVGEETHDPEFDNLVGVSETCSFRIWDGVLSNVQRLLGSSVIW
jgi:hypothetical protein